MASTIDTLNSFETAAAPIGTSSPQMAHWGAFVAESRDGEVVAARPYAGDPDPSPILENIPGSITHVARITGPAVRRGWLENGPGPTDRRGADEFVAVSWPEAIELVAGELHRLGERPESIFAGSYGWASPGLFHDAQGHLHRFLNCLGGYTRSVNSYSVGASQVILPHVVGSASQVFGAATTWDAIVEHTDLIVAFGGISAKNSAVAGGGVSRHTQRGHLAEARRRGVAMVSVSPIRDDLAGDLADLVEWMAPRPGTDVAIMLALAHVLVHDGLCDRAFVDRYCVGYERFERYLLGLDDEVVKTPEWAETLSSIPAATIRALAHRMAAGRTLVTVSWSLQRTEHGEQAPWMGIVLAAMLGQIGLPGGGFGHGYGSTAAMGNPRLTLGLPGLPQGRNGVDAFIPVARIADLLLHPGESFGYNGQHLTYPDIRLVYWAGGNPFHHHQDLSRLRRALGRPDTVVVHEPYWTPMAHHADIVLPCTTPLERNDIAGMSNDSRLAAMRQAVPAYAGSRDDYAIFSDLARALGVEHDYTEGRTATEWLEHLYETWRESADRRAEVRLPPFAEFWSAGEIELPTAGSEVAFAAFRRDPDGHRLATPSGRIEIWSEAVDGFGYDDCPGHPTWLEPQEWLGAPAATTGTLHLLANQPRTRLHSQLDLGATSQASKVLGREPIRVHPVDAAARGLVDGDVVRVFNGRGSLLAGVVISDDVRAGVVQLSTGAWYDPLDPADPNAMCVHGNPNVLTRDAGSSRLAQGSIGAHALVEIERYEGPLPPVRAFVPPSIVTR